VLPLVNLSGNPEEEYFADGVTEDLTTDLSRISGAFVIARSTAFTYKGKSVDVKQLGRELGVHYVLEGSVRRAAERVQVNVQLIDAESAALSGRTGLRPIAATSRKHNERSRAGSPGASTRSSSGMSAAASSRKTGSIRLRRIW
jgi:hypothetical protein